MERSVRALLAPDVKHSAAEDRYILLGNPVSIACCSSSLPFGLAGFGHFLPELLIERRWHYMKKKLVVPKFKNEDEGSDWPGAVYG
jgi:hypothetical protein